MLCLKCGTECVALSHLLLFVQRAVERRKAREAQNRSLQFITTDKLSGVCVCVHACVHVCACVCVHTCTNTLLDVYGHHSCFCTCSKCSLLPTLSLLGLRQSVKRVHELETLSNSLSEEVKEKSLALAHQKRTNKSVLCA